MPSRQLIASVVLAVNLATLAIVTWLRANGSTTTTTTYYGHDAPETLLQVLGKPLEQVSLTVEESVHYPLRGEDSDPEWFSLTSAGYGYVHLGPQRRTFMVTMFHELHCLRLLNLALAGSRVSSFPHARHCLGYLRQFILCSADLTLEPGDFETKDYAHHRVGAKHICRDWSAVYPFMSDNWDSWQNYSKTTDSHV